MGDLSKRLKALRLSMNLTQAEFGAMGGVSHTAQGNYESNDEKRKRTPDINYFYKLHENGIDIHYLITGEYSADRISAEESELLTLLRNADDERRSIIKDLLLAFEDLKNK